MLAPEMGVVVSHYAPVGSFKLNVAAVDKPVVALPHGISRAICSGKAL